MADRRPKLLFDAITAIQAAQEFVAGLDLPAYRADRLRRSAVERQLEILGEAAARLLKEDAAMADRMPALRLAVGMRNRIIHGYDGVDDETVFRTVGDHLPELLGHLQRWLDALTRSGQSPAA